MPVAKPILKPRENPLEETPLIPHDDYSEAIAAISAFMSLLGTSEGIYERLADWAERVLLTSKSQERVWEIANPLAPSEKRWRKLRPFLPGKALEALAKKLEQEVKG